MKNILHVGVITETPTPEGNTLIENHTTGEWTLLSPTGEVLDDSRWDETLREHVRGQA